MDYPDAQALFDALSAPFMPESVDWRVGSTNQDKSKGMALAYVDARTVMDRLDTVCGPDGWQCRYSPGVNGSIICDLGICYPPKGEWIWKADGAGATDFEGEKGALSDAFKRSAVRFGIGRYLYEMKAPWVAIEPMGKSFRIPDAERKKLDALHEEAVKRLGWGNPTDVATYKLLHQVVRDTVTQPSDATAFREKHKGMIPQLRVNMRRHLEQTLDRVGGEQETAA
jgi:hypothetical protein